MKNNLAQAEAAWRGADNVFAALEGRWQITRRIDTAPAFEGVATFTPRNGFLHYHEEGRLALAQGRGFDASRSYVFGAMPQGFAVLFDETPVRLFHEVALAPVADGCLAGEARYVDGTETYVTAYRFLPDGSFIVRQRVFGARKEYTMDSVFERLS